MTSKYKFCPKCSQPLEDDCSCPGCSYGHKRQATSKASDRPRLCAWDDHGQPCGYPAGLSDCTNGAGPWYCRLHYAKLKGHDAPEVHEVDMSQAVVDKRVNTIVPREPSESEHDWSTRCKAWALARLGKVGRRGSGLEFWRKLYSTSAPDSIGYRYAAEALLERKAVREPGQDELETT